MFDADVRSALEQAQQVGFLGERPIDQVIEHARAFVDALVDVKGIVADLGTGGGVPGLVIAHDRPDLSVMLVDRRAKRTDFLDRVVRKLGWQERVTVHCIDVEQLIGRQITIDAAVARGFGPPLHTLTLASRLVRSSGTVVISEPPHGERWNAHALESLQVVRRDDGRGAVSVFETADR